VKRFYTKAEVVEAEGGFGVALDDKPIKTPNKQPLLVPSPAIAELIAAEWNAAGDTVKIEALSATQFANTALDRDEGERARMLDEIFGYVDGDTLLYRSEDSAVADRQRTAWDPLVAWAEGQHGVRLSLSEGIMPIRQDQSVGEALLKPYIAMDPHCFVSARVLVTGLASVILTTALLIGEIDFDQAWALSILEITVQEEDWGTDPEAEAARAAKRSELYAAYRYFLAATTG